MRKKRGGGHNSPRGRGGGGGRITAKYSHTLNTPVAPEAISRQGRIQWELASHMHRGCPTLSKEGPKPTFHTQREEAKELHMDNGGSLGPPAGWGEGHRLTDHIFLLSEGSNEELSPATRKRIEERNQHKFI